MGDEVEGDGLIGLCVSITQGCVREALRDRPVAVEWTFFSSFVAENQLREVAETNEEGKKKREDHTREHTHRER